MTKGHVVQTFARSTRATRPRRPAAVAPLEADHLNAGPSRTLMVCNAGRHLPFHHVPLGTLISLPATCLKKWYGARHDQPRLLPGSLPSASEDDNSVPKPSCSGPERVLLFLARDVKRGPIRVLRLQGGSASRPVLPRLSGGWRRARCRDRHTADERSFRGPTGARRGIASCGHRADRNRCAFGWIGLRRIARRVGGDDRGRVGSVVSAVALRLGARRPPCFSHRRAGSGRSGRPGGVRSRNGGSNGFRGRGRGGGAYAFSR